MRLTPRLALLLTLPPLMWAGNAIVGRLMVGHAPPLTLNFLRWGLAVLLLLPLGWRVMRQPALVRERLGWLLAVSLLGVGVYNALQYLALVTSTPINVTLVASSTPVWMLAIGWAVFGVKPTRPQAVGAVLGLSGVLLVISRGTWETLTHVQWVAGDLYMLLAAISWAVYSWLLARPPATMQGSQRPGPQQGWDWAGLLLLQMVIGSGFAGLFALAEHQLAPAPLQWGPALWAALLFVALGPSLVAYRCWGLGVAEAGPTMAAFFANLTPLFTAIMSAALLGEPPRLYHGLAFVLIIGGIAVSSGVLRRPPASDTA